MDSARRAAAGFGLVSLGQLFYFFGGLQFGGFGLGSLVDVTSVACAAACSLALARVDEPDQAMRTVAIAMTIFAAAQVADFAQSLGLGFGGPFTFGFALVCAGLVLVAVSAWLDRAVVTKVGAGLVALGAFAYLFGGGLSLNAFTVGIFATIAGWALVALA
jgi:hypothetical protein